MITLNLEEYSSIIKHIEKMTGKSAPEIEVRLCETKLEYVSLTYAHVNFIPEYMRVTIDYVNNTITTFDKDNVNLYLLYIIYGKFNNMHQEWFDMLYNYSKYGFCQAEDIKAVNDVLFPDLLFAKGEAYNSAKARLFAEMTEKFGFNKMIEWLETPDLLYYYKYVFGEDYKKHIEACDISYYEKVMHGEIETDDATHLALWIDDKYRKDSYLEVFQSTPEAIRAAIKFNDSVLGIVCISSEGIKSYVTDYSAWMCRRAAGYAKNNPYDEDDFMEKVLSYTENESPKIIEIGIGSGRIAKPFVRNGYEYYGLDILDAMMEECKSKLGNYENLHIIKHNIMDGLPFEDDSFDILIESRVFDIESSPYLMSEINRILKNGGIAFIGVQDNGEVAECNSSIYSAQSHLMWRVYKNAYYNYYNVSDKHTRPQNQYNLGLPRNIPTRNEMNGSDYIIPKPFRSFTKGNPFSTCEYEYDFIENCRDNKFHMAFFRLECLYEPCGSDFFATLEETALSAFGMTKGKCVRYTDLRVYKCSKAVLPV